jgi:hypothetical protein
VGWWAAGKELILALEAQAEWRRARRRAGGALREASLAAWSAARAIVTEFARAMDAWRCYEALKYSRAGRRRHPAAQIPRRIFEEFYDS